MSFSWLSEQVIRLRMTFTTALFYRLFFAFYISNGYQDEAKPDAYTLTIWAKVVYVYQL